MATEKDLTLEAERAIRAYLLKLVLPTGTVLIILSFVLGFLIQHGAQNQAAKEAFQAATSEMLKGVADVEAAKIQARRLSEELTTIKDEADEISSRLQTADAFSKTESQVELIAESLAKRPDFVAKLTGVSGQIEELKTRVNSLQNPVPYSSGSGYLTIGDSLVQWGVGQSSPKTYKSQSFNLRFGSTPTLVCSADGAYENKAYCNVANVTRDGFSFLALTPESYLDAPRVVHWIAIGKRR